MERLNWLTVCAVLGLAGQGASAKTYVDASASQEQLRQQLILNLSMVNDDQSFGAQLAQWLNWNNWGNWRNWNNWNNWNNWLNWFNG